MILSAQSPRYDGRDLEQIPAGRFPLLPKGDDWIILLDTSFRPRGRDPSIRAGYNDFDYNARQFKELDSFLKQNNNLRTVPEVLEELRTGIKGLKKLLKGHCLPSLNQAICYESRVAGHLARCLAGEELNETDRARFKGNAFELASRAVPFVVNQGAKVEPPFTNLNVIGAAGAYSSLFNNTDKKVTIASQNIPLMRAWARMTRDSEVRFGRTYVSDSLIGLTVPTQNYRTADYQR